MFLPYGRLSIHACIAGLLSALSTTAHGDTREIQVYFDHSSKVSDL